MTQGGFSVTDLSHGALKLPERSVRDHWRLFLVEGLVLTVLGVAAMLIPVLAGLAVAIFLGWLFLMGGIVGLVATLMGRHAPGFWWSLLSSVVTIVAGVFLIGWPLGGAVSITLVLAAYLVVDGIVSMMFGLEHRRQMSGSWGWLFLNGVLDIVLAAIIVFAVPFAAIWVLGILIGIDFLFGGVSMIALALAARNS
jgi:uncharacterized membrane protein HdeD (DUF308 family)